jgi:hypothetical protein
LKVFLGDEVRTSNVCTKGGKDPDWNGQALRPFIIDFESNEARITLQVECWDEDKKHDKLIGKGALAFNLIGGKYKTIVEAILKTEEAKGKDAGKVQLQIVAMPTTKKSKDGQTKKVPLRWQGDASTSTLFKSEDAQQATKEESGRKDTVVNEIEVSAINGETKATHQHSPLLEDISASPPLSLNTTILKIKCLMGKGLYKVAAIGFSQDPYLKFSIFKQNTINGSETSISEGSCRPHMKASTHPDWKGEEISLAIPQKEALDQLVLRVDCYDWEEKHDDRFIGGGQVPLGNTLETQGQEKLTKETVALFRKVVKKNKKPKSAGTVDIELWVSTEGR